MMTYVWLGAFIAAIILEVLTPGALVSIWFAPAALIAMLLAIFSVPVYIQIPVFVLLSILCIVLFRPLVAKRIVTPTNVDAIIGSRAVVVERIENIAGCGLVKVGTTSWSARALSDDEIYEPDTVLTVVAVEGVKLICKK